MGRSLLEVFNTEKANGGKSFMGGVIVQIGFDAERISESHWKCL